jgi:hypothetical protein
VSTGYRQGTSYMVAGQNFSDGNAAYLHRHSMFGPGWAFVRRPSLAHIAALQNQAQAWSETKA